MWFFNTICRRFNSHMALELLDPLRFRILDVSIAVTYWTTFLTKVLTCQRSLRRHTCLDFSCKRCSVSFAVTWFFERSYQFSAGRSCPGWFQSIWRGVA